MSTPTQPAEQVSPAETTTGATDQGTSDGGSTEPTPEKLREMLTAARNEAASYRVKLREEKEARESLANHIAPETHAESTARITELEAELSRVRLAAKYSLPDRIAQRIAGTTEEERDADAKALADELGSLGNGVPLIGRGGMDPTTKTAPIDPASLAKRVRRPRS